MKLIYKVSKLLVYLAIAYAVVFGVIVGAGYLKDTVPTIEYSAHIAGALFGFLVVLGIGVWILLERILPSERPNRQ